jgi:hypothetical protein
MNELEILRRENARLHAEINGLRESYERTMMDVLSAPDRKAVHNTADLENRLRKAEAKVKRLKGIITGVHGPLYGQGLKDAFDSAIGWLTSLRPIGGRYTVFELQEFDAKLRALKDMANGRT